MPDETAESLREMARHRGLKLVTSRRRKPGLGDYGKFGLTDSAGKPLLGIGKDGLTASSEDVETYLRAGMASTWQQSAKITPDRRAPRNRRDGRETRKDAKPEAGPPIALGKSAAKPSPRGSEPSAAEGPKRRREEPASVAKLEPTLELRTAKPADADGIARLLCQLRGVKVDGAAVVRNLAVLRKSDGGAHIAELGRVVGCVAWSAIPTLQHEPVGRIGALIVDEGHRRRGIGRKLLAEAEAALARKGCAQIEAMSDIEIRNAHGFFRTLEFAQTSYRFARPIAGKRG